MAKRDKPEKYQHKYPHYLPWRKRQWVLQRGERLTANGQTYRVKEVVRSFVPGSTPQIVLEEEGTYEEEPEEI